MVFTYIKRLIFPDRSEAADVPMPPAQPGAPATREALPATPASRKRPASSTSSSTTGLPVAASKASRRGSLSANRAIKTEEPDEASQSMDESSELMDNGVQYSDMGADDEEPCTSSSILQTPSNAKPKPDRRRTGREMSEESDGSDHTLIGSPKRKTFYTINDLPDVVSGDVTPVVKSEERRRGRPRGKKSMKEKEADAREGEEEGEKRETGERSRERRRSSSLHSNQPAERFRTDILTQIRAADSEYTPSSGEASQVLRLSDRWREEWSHGVQVLLHPKNLPRFETRPCDVPAHSSGLFILPHHYIQSKDASYQREGTHKKYPVPPLRIYQGDRLDELWLERLNRSHADHRLPQLALGTMLDLMNEFEIECFQKIHGVVLASLASPASSSSTTEVDEDAPCDVCLIKEGSEDDEMFFCDGCNKCMHRSCYGMQDVPEGTWECEMCRAVTFARVETLKCALCPARGGLMKPVKGTDLWVHIICSLHLPGVKFGKDKAGCDIILGVDQVPDDRFTLKCKICDLKTGACIQCDAKGCATSFHTTCAQRSKTADVFHEKLPDETLVFKAFCKSHVRGGAEKNKKGRKRREMAEQSEDEADGRSEQLRGLERAFFLHVKFENAAKKLGCSMLHASDVYEYWKQKRTEHGGRPLLAEPDHEIEVEEDTPVLKLEDSQDDGQGGVVLSADPSVQRGMTPYYQKVYRLKRFIFQVLDKTRTECDRVRRRERQKRAQLENEREIFKKLIELDSLPVPISSRELDKIVESLEQDMTPEEIAESDRIAEEMAAWQPQSPSKRKASGTGATPATTAASPVKRERTAEPSTSATSAASPAKRAKNAAAPVATPATPASTSKRDKNAAPATTTTPANASPAKRTGATGGSASMRRATSGATPVTPASGGGATGGAGSASMRRAVSGATPVTPASGGGRGGGGGTATMRRVLVSSTVESATARHAASPSKENGVSAAAAAAAAAREEAALAAAAAAAAAAERSPTKSGRRSGTVRVSFAAAAAAAGSPPPSTPHLRGSAPHSAPPPHHSPSKKTPGGGGGGPPKTPASKRLRPQNPPDDPPPPLSTPETTASKLRERRDVRYSK